MADFFAELKRLHIYRVAVEYAAAASVLLPLANNVAPAIAQPLPGPFIYNSKSISFESWCQETQRYPADRCLARRAADLKAFEGYRAALERYEMQHLKKTQRYYLDDLRASQAGMGESRVRLYSD
jgi:hypothetical protein